MHADVKYGSKTRAKLTGNGMWDTLKMIMAMNNLVKYVNDSTMGHMPKHHSSQGTKEAHGTGFPKGIIPLQIL